MKNFLKNEKNVLNTIRYGAILFLLLFTAILTYNLIKHQKIILENEINNIEESLINQKKLKLENTVNNIYNLIENEKKIKENTLNSRLKEQVYEAYAIANAIYNESLTEPNYSEEKIIKFIKESIKNIKFNQNIGYLTIYTEEGKNILNTEFTNVQNKQDILLFQDINKLLDKKNETYYEWYSNTEEKENKTQQKKLGFFKKFEALGLYIGISDYINEFEKDLKSKILNEVNTLKIQEPDNIFIFTKEGLCLVHPDKNILEINLLNTSSEKEISDVKNTLNYALEKNEGFFHTNEKIRYIKYFKDWGWVINSSFNLSEIYSEVEKRKKNLIESTNHIINEIFIFAMLGLIFIVFISFYISSIISKIFNDYRLEINEEAKKNLENEKLIIQQSKMATMGEMLANIAHQWKQPLNLISISNGLIKINQDIKDFSTQDEINQSIENVDNSVKYLSETIDDFRNFFRPDKKEKYFFIEDSINQTTKLVSSQFKNNNIELFQEIENVEIYGYQNELSQVFINLLKNAKDELVKLDNSKRRLVFIKAYKEFNNLIIEIKDNAGGIPEEIKNKIFDAYFTTKKDDEGTGLGLYMSKQIINSMNGEINISNEKFEFEGELYKGAIFRLIIPII